MGSILLDAAEERGVELLGRSVHAEPCKRLRLDQPRVARRHAARLDPGIGLGLSLSLARVVKHHHQLGGDLT